MPLTLYCTREQLDAIWSAFGVDLRVEDEDTTAATDTVNNCIEKATVDVNLYLFQRYTPAVVAASTWASWCTAMFGCVDLARRRGNAVPQSMLDEYNRYLEALKAIAAGTMALPGDDGLAPPEFDNAPLVTNLRVDSRYRANVRRVTQTSTRADQSPNRRGYDLQSWPYPFPFN